MKTRILIAALTLVTIAVAIVGCNPQAPTTVLIHNATVIDGTGRASFIGAVRIDGDRIIEVGELGARPGEMTVDAQGKVLAPGFIDSHSHHDSNMSEHRDMLAVVSQGVTTIVRGADGASGLDEEYEFLPLAEFNARFTTQPAAVNIASYSPHGSIRYTAMGDDYRRAANDADISAMKVLLTDDLRNGALGLSTGLEYEPGIYSDTEEVIALAQVASAYGGRYSSHVRDEDDRFEEAVDEVIRIGKEAAIPVHISHIKLADKNFWGTTRGLLNKLNVARESGIEVSADIYPYLYWKSDLAVLFPDRDYTNLDAARFTFERTTDPETLILTTFPPNPNFAGLSIAEVAKLLETDVHRALLEVSQLSDKYLQENGIAGDSIVAKSMNETDVVELMRWRFTNLCSDGEFAGGHPRGFGSFPRFLSRYVSEETGISIESAVEKMTSLTATNVGIEMRGKIRAGYYADLVLFDPADVTDNATFENPTLISSGMETVWVNGVVVFRNGETTGEFPGRLLSRRGFAATE